MKRVFIPVTTVLLLFAGGAQADVQYWVSVASFDERGSAERERARAAERLNETFSVVGAQTDQGYYYRVAAGPYLTRALAEDRVRSAHAAGFDGAWMWIDSAPAISASTGDTPAGGGTDWPDLVGTEPIDYEAELRALEASFQQDGDDALGVPPAEPVEPMRPPPKLVEEAPPGYQLNRLRRGG